jgi:cytochrome c-type biogenesis protein CcmH/NrfF
MNCDSTTKFYDVANAVAQKLNCVVCAGQNIASSDATFAVNVRSDICDYAISGMNEAQITTQIMQDYGANLAMTDAQSKEMLGLNMVLLCLLLAGVAVIWRIAKR